MKEESLDGRLRNIPSFLPFSRFLPLVTIEFPGAQQNQPTSPPACRRICIRNTRKKNIQCCPIQTFLFPLLYIASMQPCSLRRKRRPALPREEGRTRTGAGEERKGQKRLAYDHQNTTTVIPGAQFNGTGTNFLAGNVYISSLKMKKSSV